MEKLPSHMVKIMSDCGTAGKKSSILFSNNIISVWYAGSKSSFFHFFIYLKCFDKAVSAVFAALRTV